MSCEQWGNDLKIQWQGGNLRVRINPNDLSVLERGQSLLERLILPTGGWTFSLERGEFTALEMRAEALILTLSEADVARLLEPDREGVYFEGMYSGTALEFCVEKDRHAF